MNEATTQRKARALSVLGVCFGFLALSGAMLHFWAGPIEPPPRIEETLADRAVKIRDAVVAKLKGEARAAEPAAASSRWGPDRLASVGTVATALLGILFGVVAYIRHESLRACGSAVALSCGAIAFQYLIFATSLIVVAILLAAILGGLEFS